MTQPPSPLDDPLVSPDVSLELGQVFARMSGLLLDAGAVDTALNLVTSLAAEAIPAATGAGVTLVDAEGVLVSAASTDRLTERADELQYRVQAGPCVAALAGGSVVRVNDVTTDQRWSEWCRAAGELGLRSALSAPLVSESHVLGAIKVYSKTVHAFEGRAERLLILFSEQAATLIANAQRYEQANRFSDDLKATLRNRELIALARGVLMGRRGMDSETAMTTMIATARREELTLNAVATNLIAAAVRRSP